MNEEIKVIKFMKVEDTLIELVHNLHCEHYELQINGVPVFNCKHYSQIEHEYNMEAAQGLARGVLPPVAVSPLLIRLYVEYLIYFYLLFY